MTVYTNTDVLSINSNIVYNGEIIQLEILHINELPNEEIIHENPWYYRFLEGRFGSKLSNVKKLDEPILAKGQLSLWDYQF